MSFSFDETLPTERDYARLRLDDVDEDDPRLSNELLDTLLLQKGLGGALLEGCNRIKLFYAKEPSTVGLTGGRRFEWRQRYDAYARLYEELSGEVERGDFDGGFAGIASAPLPHRPEDIEHYLPHVNLEPLCGLRLEDERRERYQRFYEGRCG